MLRTFCTRYPSLPVVIDHCAKPAIASGAWQPWADDIRRLAQETSAYCKLSGLVTEAARDWRTEDLRRYVDHLIDCFGPARLMWGSDWPVVNLAGGYSRWRETTHSLLLQLSVEERHTIVGGTAAKFYGLISLWRTAVK